MSSAKAISIAFGLAVIGAMNAAVDQGAAGAPAAVAPLLPPHPSLRPPQDSLPFISACTPWSLASVKSPYIINSVFVVFLLCLVIAAVAVLSALLPARLQNPALYVSAALLVAAFLFSAFRVYRIAIRFIYFRRQCSSEALPGSPSHQAPLGYEKPLPDLRP